MEGDTTEKNKPEFEIQKQRLMNFEWLKKNFR